MFFFFFFFFFFFLLSLLGAFVCGSDGVNSATALLPVCIRVCLVVLNEY